MIYVSNASFGLSGNRVMACFVAGIQKRDNVWNLPMESAICGAGVLCCSCGSEVWFVQMMNSVGRFTVFAAEIRRSSIWELGKDSWRPTFCTNGMDQLLCSACCVWLMQMSANLTVILCADLSLYFVCLKLQRSLRRRAMEHFRARFVAASCPNKLFERYGCKSWPGIRGYAQAH